MSMDSLYQKLFGSRPNYQKLRVFGCLCFSCHRPYAAHKLDSRSSRYVFLGYSFTQSAYLCLDIVTSRLYTSRHVRFEEQIFPFAKPQITQPDINIDHNLTWFPQASTVPTADRHNPCSDPHPPSSSAVAAPQSEAPSSPTASTPQSEAPSSPTMYAPPSEAPPSSATSSPAAQTSSSLKPSHSITPSASMDSSSSSAASDGDSSPMDQNRATSDGTSSAQQQSQKSQPNRPNTNRQSGGPTTQENKTAPSPAPTNLNAPAPTENQHSMKTRGKNQIVKRNKKYLHTATTQPVHLSEPTIVSQAIKDQKW